MFFDKLKTYTSLIQEQVLLFFHYYFIQFNKEKGLSYTQEHIQKFNLPVVTILNDQTEHKNLLFMTTLGFLICQIMIPTFQNDTPGYIWLGKHLGSSRVSFFMHMVIDAIIGFFVAIGVGLMVRKDKQDYFCKSNL
ncbi:hypothetical protein SAMN05660649_04112 [Desulfotomaculum arcticum]|uniref:Uncharacterized protein n=1 Tax=Desulfotruncus arcticus DSM 17038 TaxID=1121424 RepID=A0A1I2XRE8_9FIRM|nr:hypothetical protein [Desulfotruncus arcticus]SFH15972.1 hypothetical protein SAMN05660649_04112 [Desulfotomaculum arcticum] [Desulfotruncus arcticus DSM 17038]